MLISLESLFAGGVETLPLDTAFDFSGEPFNGGFPFTAPVVLRGKIENRAEVVSIKAVAEVTYHGFCDRCAREAERHYSVPIVHTLVQELSNENDEDDYILVPDQKLDVERLTLEDIYLFLPSKFLCVDDCKGICPQCGANWNETDCHCKKEIDPRLEALLAMLED